MPSRSIPSPVVAGVLVASLLGGASLTRAADGEKSTELPARTGAKFEQDGIKVSLTLPKPQVSVGQALAFDIVLENISKQDRTFLESPAATSSWQISMADANGNVWRVVPPPTSAGARATPAVIKAGDKQTVKFVLGAYYRFQRQSKGGGSFALVEQLPTGKYTLTVKRTFHGATKNLEIAPLPPLWVAEVVLDQVTFTAKFEPVAK